MFIILKESFEPIIIFFSLTNLFQIIINKILWNLINTKKVIKFINDIIIEIKEEKRYNKFIREIVKRLKENNLYIKPKI